MKSRMRLLFAASAVLVLPHGALAHYRPIVPPLPPMPMCPGGGAPPCFRIQPTPLPLPPSLPPPAPRPS